MHWLKAHTSQRDCNSSGVTSHEVGGKQGLPKVTPVTFPLDGIKDLNKEDTHCLTKQFFNWAKIFLQI